MSENNDLSTLNVNQPQVVDVKPSNKKEKKPKSKVRSAIEWVLFGIFMIIFIALGAGMVDGMIHKNENYNQSIKFGVGSFIVLTDSMYPKYNKKDAIITYKEDLNKVISDFENGVDVDITFYCKYMGDILAEEEITTERFKYVNGGRCVWAEGDGFVMTHKLMEVHPREDGHYVFVAAGINTGGELAKEGQYQVFTEKEYLGVVKIGSPFLGGVFGFISSVWGLLVLLLIPAFYLIVTSAIDIFKTLKESEEQQASGDHSIDSLKELSNEDRERLKREILDQMIANKQKEKGEQNETKD